MIHHPVILIPKLVVLAVIAVILIILRGVLTPRDFTIAVVAGAVVFVVFCIALWIFVLKALKNPRSRLTRATVLSHQASSDKGFTASSGEFASLVGKHGIAVSPLNPSGKAVFDGKRISVQADGEFIDTGSPVEVVAATGLKVVVIPARRSGEQKPETGS